MPSGRRRKRPDTPRDLEAYKAYRAAIFRAFLQMQNCGRFNGVVAQTALSRAAPQGPAQGNVNDDGPKSPLARSKGECGIVAKSTAKAGETRELTAAIEEAGLEAERDTRLTLNQKDAVLATIGTLRGLCPTTVKRAGQLLAATGQLPANSELKRIDENDRRQAERTDSMLADKYERETERYKYALKRKYGVDEFNVLTKSNATPLGRGHCEDPVTAVAAKSLRQVELSDEEWDTLDADLDDAPRAGGKKPGPARENQFNRWMKIALGHPVLQHCSVPPKRDPPTTAHIAYCFDKRAPLAEIANALATTAMHDGFDDYTTVCASTDLTAPSAAAKKLLERSSRISGDFVWVFIPLHVHGERAAKRFCAFR
jgi:hypothetical protein